MVLTVDEAKQHLRIEYDEEDELIENLEKFVKEHEQQ